MTVLAPPAGGGAGGPWHRARHLRIVEGDRRSVCGVEHPPTVPGSLDESERRLSHEELAVAERLASEGHRVKSLAERRDGERTADLEVCGQPVEIKSWLSLADRAGAAPTARSVVNKLRQAEGQSPTVVLFAGASGLSARAATEGVSTYNRTAVSSRVQRVRVMGDGFDLVWARTEGLNLGSRRAARPAGRDPGAGAERPAGAPGLGL